MNLWNKSTRRYSLAIIYMIALLVLSNMSGNQAKELSFLEFFQADKVYHILAYMVLSFLLIRSVSVNHSSKALFWSLIISISYGIAMELMQYGLFMGRHFEILDIIANIIGAILGVTIYRKLKFK